MTFPPPSEEEIEEWRRRNGEHDKKITAAKLRLERVKDEDAKKLPLGRLIPTALSRWASKRFTVKPTDAVQEAEVEYLWTVYDKTAYKRPLYPRKRAITPTNESFDKARQSYLTQEQSSLFAILPPELRAEVYRKLFGKLIIDIEAGHSGFGGPVPSEDYKILRQRKIVDVTTGGELISGSTSSYTRNSDVVYISHIIPLLQTCRRIYCEAIVLLYSESMFKNHGRTNQIGWTKYLLHQRLQTIRTLHHQLELGYPWNAPSFRIVLEAIAGLKSLQKLCLVGNCDGMIDSQDMNYISEGLWRARKHVFIPLFQEFSFISDVDIFLPIMQSVLVDSGETVVNGSRLHGVTPEECLARKPLLCACEFQPERVGIRWKP